MTAAHVGVYLPGVSMRIRAARPALLVLSAAACGGDGGGGGPAPPPTVHTIVPDDPNMIGPADIGRLWTFSAIDAGRCAWPTITEHPDRQPHADTFKVTVADDASFQSGAPVAAAIHGDRARSAERRAPDVLPRQAIN